MCTYPVKPSNYKDFARTAKKRAFLGGRCHSNGRYPKLDLRVSGKLKCESFGACKKRAKNNWGGGQNGAKTAKFDHFWRVVAIVTTDTPNLEL